MEEGKINHTNFNTMRYFLKLGRRYTDRQTNDDEYIGIEVRLIGEEMDE